MAKPPKPKVKAQRSAQSTTNPKGKNKGESKPLPVVPADCCGQLFGGKPYGTMVAAEDGGCRDIDPPQGMPPWVPFWHPDINGNWPYWESLSNLEAAPGGGMRLKPDVHAERCAGAMPGDAPPEPPPPWQTVT